MSWPENNPNLHELRRKWDEGHFRQDADSVYGIDEAIDAAITEISTYNDHIPGFQAGGNLAVKDDARQLAEDIIEGRVKTCRICRLTARNDPCDTCYSRWRRASQTPSEAGICVFCQNKSPSVICVPCVERVLRDGLG